MAVVALASGCDFVFRLDEVTAPIADAATVDGPCTPGPWSVPSRISANSIAEDDEDPAIHPSGTIMVFTRAGASDADLYVAVRSGMDFGSATKLPFSTAGLRQSGAFWSPLGDRLYFKQETQMLVSEYEDGAFAAPTPTTAFDSLVFVQRPRLASDELELFYYRDVPTDIWRATRLSLQAPWNEEKLAVLSSDEYEDGPSVTSDDLTVYYNSRAAAGERHIFTASRATRTSPFDPPTDLGNFGIEAPVSPDISRDGLTMLMAAYPTATSDIYVMHRTCE